MISADAHARMDAAKARIASGRTGYLAAMIGAHGTDAQMRIAREADAEIRDLWSVIRNLENEISMARTLAAARKEGK